MKRSSYSAYDHLCAAIREQDFPLAAELIARGTPVNGGPNDNPPTVAFCLNSVGSLSLLPDLMKAGLDLTCTRKNFKGNILTAVHTHLEVADPEHFDPTEPDLWPATALLRAGASISTEDCTDLLSTALLNNWPIPFLERLVQEGVSIHGKPGHWSPLLYATANRKHDVVLQWLMDNGADPREKDAHGRSALDWAKKNFLTSFDILYQGALRLDEQEAITAAVGDAGRSVPAKVRL